ncbi:MAG: mevalonate kinase family protein [Candidatus Zhuqueibacterota bacterium]
MTIETCAYARAGLLGNPSDGYFGKAISISVRNFAARVRITESALLRVLPARQDRNEFDSMADLVARTELHGYDGGERLLKAAIKIFHDYCLSNGIELARKNFTMEYDSSIPRQIGLAGSSAIVTAAMRGLMQFYGVTIPLPLLPTLILNAELQELGIHAGLQDRVIQVYEGCVYMDFDQTFVQKHGHGAYEPLSPDLLPALYIAYNPQLGKISGRLLSDIRLKYDRGDAHVIGTLNRIASLAERGKTALRQGDFDLLHGLMNENFDRRSEIMPVSEPNKELVRTARACGASAKFAGSGGSIIGMYPSEESLHRLKIAMKKCGADVIIPQVKPGEPD